MSPICSFRIGSMPLLRAYSLNTICTYPDPPLNAPAGRSLGDLKYVLPEPLPAAVPLSMDDGVLGAHLDVPHSNLWDSLHGSTKTTWDLHCKFYKNKKRLIFFFYLISYCLFLTTIHDVHVYTLMSYRFLCMMYTPYLAIR